MKTPVNAALSEDIVAVQGLFLRFSLFISLLAGKSVAETRSIWTASATTQSYANRDFPVRRETLLEPEKIARMHAKWAGIRGIRAGGT